MSRIDLFFYLLNLLSIQRWPPLVASLDLRLNSFLKVLVVLLSLLEHIELLFIILIGLFFLHHVAFDIVEKVAVDSDVALTLAPVTPDVKRVKVFGISGQFEPEVLIPGNRMGVVRVDSFQKIVLV